MMCPGGDCTPLQEYERIKAALGERYVVERELGHGGMARVYLATDSKLGRRVAIKVLKGEISTAVGPERFLREIKITAGLAHPNILTLIDSGELDGLLYYVMPYVEGESLREKLSREGRIPVAEAVPIAREVAAALQYAHDHGIVHRDIKPENILLSGGDAFVADFGVARAVSEASDAQLTISGHSVGTPVYMSPEQAGGEKAVDRRTDIYALSCVLYEMLTGRPPHIGESVRALMAGHMFDEPTPVRQLAPSVPESLATTIQKGLAKKPDERFDSAADFTTALDLAGLGARPPTPILWLLLRGVAAVALVGLVLYAAWHLLIRESYDLDPSKIVVFPLIDRNDESNMAAAGLDVAIAVEMAFLYKEPLKWIDGWERLSDEARREPTLLNAELARSIAREVGAGFYVDGTLGAIGDSLSVYLRLHDVAGDSVVTGSVAQDLGRDVTYASLGLGAVVGLLPELLAPGRDVELSALTGRDPQAVALWIAGEREYRLGQFESALALYEEALADDSLLLLPATKGALASTWLHDDAKAGQLIDVAVALDSLLPVQYGHLAHGVRAYLSGDADSAVACYRRAIAVDSTFTEAVMELAEIYYHMFPSELHLDSLARAALERVIELDPDFMPARFHLAQIEIRAGQLESAEANLGRLESAEFPPRFQRELRLMIDCVRNGPDAIPWGTEVDSSSAAVFVVGRELAATGAHFSCAEAAFRAVVDDENVPLGHRWSALLGLQGILVTQGRVDETLELLERMVASGITQTYTLYTVDLVADRRFEMAESRVAGLAGEWFGADYARGGPSLKWQMGVHHSLYPGPGRSEIVQRLHEAVDSVAEESGSRRTKLLARALEGHAAAVRGDTLRAIELFDALKPTAPRDSLMWDLQDPLAVEKLRLAQLLYSRREYQRAFDVASIFDYYQPLAFLPYLAASLSIRMNAAAALGNREDAARCRERLIRMGRSDLAGSD